MGRPIDADALKDALIKRTGLKWDWLLTMIPCCRAIDDAPTIRPEPQKIGKWIPCKERLPEESGMYLVSGKRKVWVCEFTRINVAGVKISGWENDASNPVVMAWQPLPESYKEEADG